MYKHKFRTYLYRDNASEFTYESQSRLGSRENYYDLVNRGKRLYGKYFPLDMFVEDHYKIIYKKMIKGSINGFIRRTETWKI